MSAAVNDNEAREQLAVDYATMIRETWEAAGQPPEDLGGALIWEALNILFGLGMSRQALAAATRDMADLIERGEDPRDALTPH